MANRQANTAASLESIPGEPAVDWNSVTDSSLNTTWNPSAGAFGYGDGDDASLLADMQGSDLTVYSRISFGITPEMDANRHLQLTVDYDDACIVFLDGEEGYRSPNIPAATDTPYAFDEETLSSNHEASAGSGG